MASVWDKSVLVERVEGPHPPLEVRNPVCYPSKSLLHLKTFPHPSAITQTLKIEMESLGGKKVACHLFFSI